MTQRNYYKLRVGEEILGGTGDGPSVFSNGGFLLTSQRAIHIDKTDLRNESGVRLMNLEDIDAIETMKVRHNYNIVFAIFSIILAALFSNIPDRPNIGFLITAACSVYFAIMYFITRRNVIRLVSNSTFMLLNVTEMNANQVETVIEEIDQARQQRMKELHLDGS